MLHSMCSTQPAEQYFVASKLGYGAWMPGRLGMVLQIQWEYTLLQHFCVPDIGYAIAYKISI
jgi:hypothetical protein